MKMGLEGNDPLITAAAAGTLIGLSNVASTSRLLPTRTPAARSGSSQMAMRLVYLVVALAASGVLGVAAYLHPDSRGHGTHQQLGLPACTWDSAFNLPCPTCGMTTAFSYSAHGQFLKSFQAQPMGFLLSIATACALLLGLYGAVTGAHVMALFSRWWGARLVWVVIALLVAAWVYKILVFRGVL